MPDLEISNLPNASAPAGTEQLAVVQAGVTRRIEISELFAALDAALVPFTPAGSIAATNVQDAIEEAASEAGGSPTAASVSFTPAGTIASTNVQDALEEVASEGGGGGVQLDSGGTAQIIVNGSESTAANGTGILQIGVSGVANIGLDNNEIQARNGAGVGSSLNLNPHGGQTIVNSGTAALPGLAFSGLTNTGFHYELVAGLFATLWASVAGTDRMSIAATLAAAFSGSGSECTVADGTGELQVGATGAANLGMDGSEIQARSGGAAAILDLNPAGGAVRVGGVSIGGSLTPDTMADDTWVGPTATLTAAESLVIGDVCYINSSSKMAKGDADAAATAGVMCIATATIAADATGTFGLPGGYLRDDSAYAFTPGQTIYLSTTPGGITATAPSGAADVVQVLGYAHEADIVFFNPSPVLIEVGV